MGQKVRVQSLLHVLKMLFRKVKEFVEAVFQKNKRTEENADAVSEEDFSNNRTCQVDDIRATAMHNVPTLVVAAPLDDEVSFIHENPRLQSSAAPPRRKKLVRVVLVISAIAVGKIPASRRSNS